MRKESILTVLILIVFAVFSVEHAFSQDDEMLEKMEADEELQQELKWLKAETFVITASKVMENIKKAPASITVITDRQIRQMGARHLADVLRTVPGIQPWYHWNGNYLFNFRNTGSGEGSNKVLIMLNSNPLNTPFQGGTTWVNDTLIVDNIKRIEVIRGPGSAVYGANAFNGVINIITKEAEDIDGFELTARGGSWDTQQYNLLYGKAFSDLEVAFNFNYFKTHGFRGLIEEDYQTLIDQRWTEKGIPSNASLAPGRMAGDDEKYDVQLTLKYKGFTFDGRYVDREKDLHVSVAGSLNHKSVADPKDYYLTLSYERSVWEGLDLSGKVYRNLEDLFFDYQVFPPGYVTLTPTWPAVMPEGWLYEESHKHSRTGAEIQATYNIVESNTVVAGITYEELKQYDFTIKANVLPQSNFDDYPRVVTPLPSVQKWPDEFTEDTEKINFKAVFVEDIWDITDNLRLTTGLRYDRYSNFGGEFSPRAGLTWEYIKGYDLKLLYGHAFRAPSFFELFSANYGNPDLQPETMDTYEASLGADFNSSLSARITGYYSKGKDIITYDPLASPQTLTNFGKARRHGFEVEVKYDFGRGTYLAGNYSYGSTAVAKMPSGMKTRNWTSPRHNGNIMANIRLSRYLNFFTNCYFEDGFRRQFGDSRDDMSGYAIVDATLIARKFLRGYEGLELRASVYNLFDKEYSSPQDDRLPYDLPMPGINFLLEMKYGF